MNTDEKRLFVEYVDSTAGFLLGMILMFLSMPYFYIAKILCINTLMFLGVAIFTIGALFSAYCFSELNKIRDELLHE